MQQPDEQLLSLHARTDPAIGGSALSNPTHRLTFDFGGTNTGNPVVRQVFAPTGWIHSNAVRRGRHREVGAVLQQQVDGFNDGADILLRARTPNSGFAGSLGQLP